MKEVIDFFRRLHDDNTREWFDAHRAEWAHVKGRFAAFTEQLIEGIAEFDPTVRGLRVQDCTYRIARDTRFSPDKSPYKTYIGAYIAPKGKKSGFAKKITEEFLLSDDLLERTLAEFRRTQPFIAILNRAVQFAYEEMM